MALSPEQLQNLKDAAATLTIIGKFGLHSNTEEPIMFKGASLSSHNFFDKVKPSLGRKYSDTTIGKHLMKSIEILEPKDAKADSMQPIHSDSPLLQGRYGESLAAQGREVFGKIITLLDTITRYQHPKFSYDLIELTWNFIVECHEKDFAETDKLAKFCRKLEVKRLIQLYLLCPSRDDETVLRLLEPLLKSGSLGQELGQKTTDIFIESLSKLKEVLSSTDDIANIWKNTTKPGTSCSDMADDNGYYSIPKIEASATKDFRSAYRHLKLATDDLHAICGSPELWSYIFWWLGTLAGDLPENGATEAKTPGVKNLYKLCVQEQAQRVPPVGAKLLENRESIAKVKLASFGMTLDERVREITRLQAEAILNEMRIIFNPKRPTSRKQIENKVAILYKALAFFKDKGWGEKFASYQSVFSSNHKINCAILIAKNDDGSSIVTRLDFERYLKNTVSLDTQDQVFRFTESAAFAEVSEGPDLNERINTAFYGFIVDIVLHDFEVWAKMNEAENIEKTKRVERLFRVFHLGQLGSGASEMPGMPITLTLNEITAEDLQNSLIHLDRLKVDDTSLQVDILATTAIINALGEVESGQIVIDNETGGNWSKKGNAIAIKLEKPILVQSLVTAELRTQSGHELTIPLAIQEGKDSPKLENVTKQAKKGNLISLDLASIDLEVNGAIKDSSIIMVESDDELLDFCDADLMYWENLLQDLHDIYVDGATDASARNIQRSYRAATLGKFLLAVPDSLAPFEREDISNIMGLLLDMTQQLGALHDDKTFAISNNQAELDSALRKINLSQYYPVADEAELSLVFNYHYSLIKSIENTRIYLSEVNAIAKLFDAAHGSGLTIVVANNTLGEAVSQDFASNNVLTNHPSRTVYLTSQNEVNDLYNAWVNLQLGLSTPTSLQIPIFVAHESLHRSNELLKIPLLLNSEKAILPTSEHCLGMEIGGEWLAVACACTSADSDKLGIYIKKTVEGHKVYGLGVLRPIKKNIEDNDGLGDVARNNLANNGLIGDYRELKSVVTAIREGLVKSKNSNDYLNNLFCARLLTVALMESANQAELGRDRFPVRLVQALGDSSQFEDMLPCLLFGLTNKKLTLTSQGALLEGLHKPLSESNLCLNIGKQGEDLRLIKLIIPEWMLEFANKGVIPDFKVLV
jgi:hypothetical protein